MRFVNPFNNSHNYLEASISASAIALMGLTLAVLAVERIIPPYFVWPGVLLFVIGWITVGYVWVVRIVRAIRQRRR